MIKKSVCEYYIRRMQNTEETFGKIQKTKDIEIDDDEIDMRFIPIPSAAYIESLEMQLEEQSQRINDLSEQVRALRASISEMNSRNNSVIIQQPTTPLKKSSKKGLSVICGK